jgi:Kelch motif
MTQVSRGLRRRRLAPLVAAIACLIVLGLAPQASAAVVGYFSPTGPISLGFGAVAAPLPDGRVLFAGGFYSGGGHQFTYLSSAEVFHPSTNTFSTAGIGSMSVPREGAVAAPLPDGRVLVAGGYYNANPDVPFEPHYLSSAEVFDPSTNTFSSAGIGSMSVPREGAVAAPLPDGRVLVAGGLYNDGTGHDLSSAEVFDPATNSFSSAGVGSMSVPRSGAIAAPLPDGRVLVGGGSTFSNLGNPLSSAEVFNPTTNTFSSAGIGSMSAFPGSARVRDAAAPLPDGRVVVGGGNGDDAEIFTLATNDFTFRVQGKRLIVSVQAPGKVSVAGAPSPRSASPSKKRMKKPRLLKPSHASGNPPTITVKLALTKAAKSRLKAKGRVTVRARITFTGPGGLANTRMAKLKIKGQGRKK